MSTTSAPASSPCTWGSSAEGAAASPAAGAGPFGRRRPAPAVRQLAGGRCRRHRARGQRPRHRARAHDGALDRRRRPAALRPVAAGMAAMVVGFALVCSAFGSGGGSSPGPRSRLGGRAPASDRAALRRLRVPAGSTASRCSPPRAAASSACRPPGTRPTSPRCAADDAGDARRAAARARRRASRTSRTDVISLEAELLGVEELGAAYLASIEFSGLIRESAEEGEVPFRELWMLAGAKDEGTPRGGWRASRRCSRFSCGSGLRAGVARSVRRPARSGERGEGSGGGVLGRDRRRDADVGPGDRQVGVVPANRTLRRSGRSRRSSCRGSRRSRW